MLPPVLFSKLQFLIQLISLGYIWTVGEGFKQELWLYQKSGNALHFQSHVADTSIYAPVLKQVYKYCVRGKWSAYGQSNFSKTTVTLGHALTPDLWCSSDVGDQIRKAKSFRYWGANDTSMAAISLYSDELYGGQEILVTGQAYAEITGPIKSIVATGKMNWRLFEGPLLNGKSICYKVPTSLGAFFNGDSVANLKGIKGVKSVFRGCDLKEAKVYKNAFLL